MKILNDCECCFNGDWRGIDPIFGTYIHTSSGFNSREMIQCSNQHLTNKEIEQLLNEKR